MEYESGTMPMPSLYGAAEQREEGRVEAGGGGGGGGGCGEAPKTPAAMIALGSRSSSSLIRDVGFIICILNRWRARGC